MENKINKIIEWLNKKLEKSGTTGFVIGLSGGIDSALVSVLAKKTKGKVLALIMPCHSHGNDAEHAIELADKFSIDYKIIDLSETYDNFLKILPESDNLNKANLKSRLRMCTLYYHAGLYNRLVLGTGNKTELMTGYFTKYGDSGVDLLPIADLYKHEVYKVSETLNINKKIIEKAPSAGLWEGQTDEQEMGITYELLDKILYNILNDLPLTDFYNKTVDKVKKMINSTQHKRNTPEICKM